jgi:hypothetical protein
MEITSDQQVNLGIGSLTYNVDEVNLLIKL